MPDRETSVYAPSSGAVYAPSSGAFYAKGGLGAQKKAEGGPKKNWPKDDSGDLDAPSSEEETQVSVAKVTVKPSSVSLQKGATQQFAVTLLDASGNELTGRAVSWATSNSAVATVTSGGLVTAIDAGSATITAKSENVSGTATVSVTSPVAPVEGVQIQPGQSIQSFVNAHPDGTTFVIKAGTHRQQAIVPKNGQKFIGEGVAVLDGENVTQYAFRGTASDVVIKGLTIQRYQTPSQMGAITASDHSASTASGWLLENNIITQNYSLGVRIGSRMVLRNNKVIRNRALGVGGIGDDVLVEGNEIAYNNPDLAVSPGWEAGGTKFVKTNRLVVRNNYVHHNKGPGLWTDINNRHTLYENNVSEDNLGPGIFHEISFDAIIRNNQTRRNGSGGSHPYGEAGIRISNSENVTVTDNLVEDNDNGIIGMQQPRPGEAGHSAPYKLKNLKVSGNTVRMTRGLSGIVRDDGDDAVFSSYGNKFTANRYSVATSKSNWWAWANAAREWSPWRGYGQDPDGTMTY